jgi:hypothetical protein
MGYVAAVWKKGGMTASLQGVLEVLMELHCRWHLAWIDLVKNRNRRRTDKLIPRAKLTHHLWKIFHIPMNDLLQLVDHHLQGVGSFKCMDRLNEVFLHL